MVVFRQVFPVLAGVMFPFIAYVISAGVGEIKENNIIRFLDGIYMRLGQWRYLEYNDIFSKERFTILRIVKSCHD